VSFDVISCPQTASIIGKQSGKTIVSFSLGDDLDETVTPILIDGIRSSDSMFTVEESQVGAFTSILRVGGVLLNYIGWDLLLNPLVTTFAIIPAVSSLSGIGVAIVAVPLAASVSGCTIVFAWLDARARFRIFKYPLRLGYLGVTYTSIATISGVVSGFLVGAGSYLVKLFR